jgi:hypothetical protein
MPDGGRHFNVDFHVAAFSADGKPVAHTDTQIDAPATPKTYEQIRYQGLPFHTVLKLGAGRYQVRLVVRDNRTGFLGSVDVPLILDESLKPDPSASHK